MAKVKWQRHHLIALTPWTLSCRFLLDLLLREARALSASQSFTLAPRPLVSRLSRESEISHREAQGKSVSFARPLAAENNDDNLASGQATASARLSPHLAHRETTKQLTHLLWKKLEEREREL